MQTVIHELKADSAPFFDILVGTKRCEIRWAKDRQFKVGDILRLREFDRIAQTYSNRECSVEVLHIQTGYGLPNDLIVMSISAPLRS